MARKLEFIGVDSWGRPTYRDESFKLWLDTNLGSGEPDLHRSTSNEFDEGEPDYRIEGEYALISQYKENPYKFEYQMLSMLQSRCEYYFGHGNKSGSIEIEEIISGMKERWINLPEDGKPEWLTWEQILEYDRRLQKHERVCT